MSARPAVATLPRTATAPTLPTPRPRLTAPSYRAGVAGFLVALAMADLVLAVAPGTLLGGGLAMVGTAVGPAVGTLLGVLLLADALRRGRAGAWWATLLLCAAQAVCLVVDGAVAAAGPVLCWAGLAGLLLVRSSDWSRAVPRRTVRPALRALGAGSAAAAVGVLLIGLMAGIALSLPIVLAWAFGLGLLAASIPVLYAQPDAPRTTRCVRASLRTHGGGSLGWQRTWTGFTTWSSPTGDVVVSYRRSLGAALVLGDPVGPRSQWPQAIEAFESWCDGEGLVPAWYAATPASLPAHGSARTLHIGEDAVLDLTTVTFRGKRWQDVRTALNRAEREQIRLVCVDLAAVAPDVRRQVDALSQQWVDDKPLPELGFTLGGVAEALDPDVRTHLAVGADGTVHGITTWLPVHEHGVLTGWTLDLMRRRTDGFRPVMEFLLARSAQVFQAEGYRTMSLSVAPLARRTSEGGVAGRLDKGLDRVAGLLEPAYGFGSLVQFKAKFAPHFSPVYLVYRRTADLPDIAVAISHAYLPHVSPGDLLRTGRLLVTAGRR